VDKARAAEAAVSGYTANAQVHKLETRNFDPYTLSTSSKPETLTPTLCPQARNSLS